MDASAQVQYKWIARDTTMTQKEEPFDLEDEQQSQSRFSIVKKKKNFLLSLFLGHEAKPQDVSNTNGKDNSFDFEQLLDFISLAEQKETSDEVVEKQDDEGRT